MAEAAEPPLTPDPPHAPGTPSLADLDVPEPMVLAEARRAQDVRDEAGAVEPPD